VLGKTSEGPTLEEMAGHERVHLRKFNELLPAYRVRPTLLLPLWDAAGYALGFGSALLGKEAAYAVTVAVETVIAEHYNDQLRFVHQTDALSDETELRQVFKQFRDDEQEHLDIGLEKDAERAPFYKAITAVVSTGCKTAIWFAKKV
jgi:ubiquinone biosynthesis monooxygenase Coq7